MNSRPALKRDVPQRHARATYVSLHWSEESSFEVARSINISSRWDEDVF